MLLSNFFKYLRQQKGKEVRIMTTKIKITFVVPQPLQHELRHKVINDGYGLRGKSKWVAEAIESLLQLDNHPDLVYLGDEMHGFGKVETISVDRSLKKTLDQAIHNIRKRHPLLEGVQSGIIRTSILQRLLRS